MVKKQTQTFDSEKEMLDTLVESLLPPKIFVEVNNSYVSIEPVKSSSRISYEGKEHVDKNGVVVQLDLPQQLYLYEKFAKKIGMKVRHGSLRENLNAVYSEKDFRYKENVLIPYWVLTNEIIVREPVGDIKSGVYRIVGAEFSTTHPTEAKNIGKLIPKIKLGSFLQDSIPSNSGYYTDFSDAIPKNDELTSKSEKSKGYFGINFGKYELYHGLYLIRCAWDLRHNIFVGCVYPMSSLMSFPLALSVWTDENPRK